MCRPIGNFESMQVQANTLPALVGRTGQVLELLVSDLSGLVSYYLAQRRRS